MVRIYLHIKPSRKHEQNRSVLDSNLTVLFFVFNKQHALPEEELNLAVWLLYLCLSDYLSTYLSSIFLLIKMSFLKSV